MSGSGWVAPCSDVKCDAGLTCNPQTGVCEDTSCNNVTCFPPQVCKLDTCVDQGTGGASSSGTGANGGAGDLGGAPATSTTSAGGAGGTTGDKGSCRCRVGAPIAAVAAALGLASAVRRRRRAAR